MYELSRWTSTLAPSGLVTVVSKPEPGRSVVTGPAVPLPTLLTAAAWALAAASPVTGFSAFSCAAVPGAGPLNPGGGGVPDWVWGVVPVPDDVAAPAMAAPPRPSAASAATPARTFLLERNIAFVLSIVRAYLSYLRRRPDSIVGSLQTIARAEGAALVHCAAGKDRTGVVVALALDAVGVERDAIVADYLASGDRIEEIMARLVSSSTYRAELQGHDPRQHAPAPGTMERFLAIVDERFGGSVEWLSAYGLGPSDLERLRRRLVRAGAAASS